MALFVIVLVALFAEVSMENVVDNKEAPFRVQKLNLLWEKATKRLDKEQQLTLHGNLVLLDNEWMSAKHAGEKNSDVLLRSAEKKLARVMAQFGLEGMAESLDHHQSKQFAEPRQMRERTPVVFKDKKLMKLWLQTLDAGLSEEELDALKEEFTHYEEKLADLNARLAQENDVRTPDGKKQKTPGNEDSKTALKARYKELDLDFDRLKMRVNEQKNITRIPFSHERVRRIWEQALTANFTEKELLGLAEELLHFEQKLQKLDHMSVSGASAGTIPDKKKQKTHVDKNVNAEDAANPELKKYRKKIDMLEEQLRAKIGINRMEL